MGPRRVAYAVIAVACLALPLASIAPAHSGVDTGTAVQPFLAAASGGVIADRVLGDVRPPLPAQLKAALQPGAAAAPPVPRMPDGRRVTEATTAAPRAQNQPTRRSVASRSSRPGQASARIIDGLRWPAPGPVTSPFGQRWGRHHEGIDIAASHGAPILAASGGTVVYAGWYGGYGQTVVVDVGSGVTTVYGHASKLLVAAGEQIEAGQEIARVGSSGEAYGPHLHFEIRVGDRPVDPLRILAGLISPPAAAESRAPARRAAASSAVYRVQVGAYRIRENAQAQVDQLRGEGFTPLIARTSVLYKVQVGAFASRPNAGRLAEDLRARGYEAFVTP